MPEALELCQVCWWQDDGQDDRDADVVRRTVNGNLSASARDAATTSTTRLPIRGLLRTYAHRGKKNSEASGPEAAEGNRKGCIVVNSGFAFFALRV